MKKNFFSRWWGKGVFSLLLISTCSGSLFPLYELKDRKHLDDLHGAIVALKFSNGKYASVGNDNYLRATASKPKQWEQFQLLRHEKHPHLFGFYSLKTKKHVQSADYRVRATSKNFKSKKHKSEHWTVEYTKGKFYIKNRSFLLKILF